MEGRMKLKYLMLLGAVAVPSIALAQEEAAEPEQANVPHSWFAAPAKTTITVLASGSRERLDWTGESISVFGREAMDAVQGAALSRLLERAPGVPLSRNGGPG